MLRKIPRKYEANAKRRERWLSAWRVNPCGGAFALKVKGSPRRTVYELLFKSARLRAYDFGEHVLVLLLTSLYSCVLFILVVCILRHTLLLLFPRPLRATAPAL